jgi:hypothetical protein
MSGVQKGHPASCGSDAAIPRSLKVDILMGGPGGLGPFGSLSGGVAGAAPPLRGVA